MVRVSIRTSWVVNIALFHCYRPVNFTRPPIYAIRDMLLTIHAENKHSYSSVACLLTLCDEQHRLSCETLVPHGCSNI